MPLCLFIEKAKEAELFQILGNLYYCYWHTNLIYMRLAKFETISKCGIRPQN